MACSAAIILFVYNGTRLNDVFNLNNDTMTTEERELKSAEWRIKNLSKNSVLADVIKSVCANCGKPIEQHSKATQLCPDRFAHFEQTVL